MLTGCLKAIIAIIIGQIKYNAMIRRCRVNPETFAGRTFEHKGIIHDLEMYISNRKPVYNQKSKPELLDAKATVEKDIAKGRAVGLNTAELEAINAALAEFSN